jgi:hypothetical protein
VVFVTTTITFVLAGIFAAAGRVVSRFGIVKRHGWDDYTFILAWVSGDPQLIAGDRYRRRRKWCPSCLSREAMQIHDRSPDTIGNPKPPGAIAGQRGAHSATSSQPLSLEKARAPDHTNTTQVLRDEPLSANTHLKAQRAAPSADVDAIILCTGYKYDYSLLPG